MNNIDEYLHEIYNEETGMIEMWLSDKPQQYKKFEYAFINKMGGVKPTFDEIKDAISSLIDNDETAMISINKQLDSIMEQVKEIITYQRDNGIEYEKRREKELKIKYGIV